MTFMDDVRKGDKILRQLNQRKGKDETLLRWVEGCVGDYTTQEDPEEKKTAPKVKGGKPRNSLTPLDILQEFVVPGYEEGCLEYERESWRRGFLVSEMIDAMDRHRIQFMSGEDYDKRAKEVHGINKHHVGAMAFYCLSILHTLKYHPDLDDRRDPATGELLRKGIEPPDIKKKEKGQQSSPPNLLESQPTRIPEAYEAADWKLIGVEVITDSLLKAVYEDETHAIGWHHWEDMKNIPIYLMNVYPDPARKD